MSNPTDTPSRDGDAPLRVLVDEPPDPRAADGEGAPAVEPEAAAGGPEAAAGEPESDAESPAAVEPEDDAEAITRVYGRPSRTIPLVLLAAVGGYIMMLTLGTALQLRLSAMDEATATTVYSRITTVSGILMLVAIPLIGALSDRTTSRFGRRRPWILGGYLVSLACMAVIGIMTGHLVIGAAYVVGITAAQAGFNAYSVIPVEGVPNKMRARVMGFMGMMGALAMSAGAAIAGRLVGTPALMMTVPVLLALATTFPLILLYKDPQRDKDDVPALDLGGLIGGFFVDPRKHPNFGWVWLSRFLAGVAMTAFLAFFVLYLITNLHYSPAEAGARASLLSLYSVLRARVDPPVHRVGLAVGQDGAAQALRHRLGRRHGARPRHRRAGRQLQPVRHRLDGLRRRPGHVPHRRPGPVRPGPAQRGGHRQGHGGLRASPQPAQHPRPGRGPLHPGRREQLHAPVGRRGRPVRAGRPRHPLGQGCEVARRWCGAPARPATGRARRPPGPVVARDPTPPGVRGPG